MGVSIDEVLVANIYLIDNHFLNEFINNHGYIRTLLSELVMVRSCDEGEESPM